MLLAALTAVAACHPVIRSPTPNPPTAAQMAALWLQPERARDLFWGVGGKRLAPSPAGKYTVIEIKRSGFSQGYTVSEQGDRRWSVKFPPEAATEVVASRIHWGLGYHQPPVYYLAAWTADKAVTPNPQLPARFREAKPDFHGLKSEGSWSYYHNPFVGTPQLQGLLVLQAMLGNSDLKDDNNALYELAEPVEGAKRWYVARDLGHTFGRTGVLQAPRGDIAVFEQTPFITGVVNGRVQLDWRGRHDALFANITPSDVRWICARLATLTDQQWHDAFRAGGFDPQTTTRFIARLKQKIAQGLALEG
ncbi:MAG: hypothetical protein ABIX28_00150 [Vicinamibacterales bacterium]